MSVANTWIFGESPSSPSACSRSSMASEYASSPVAHPGTHTRSVSLGALPANSRGSIVRLSSSNVSESRKNAVTPISRSWNSIATSRRSSFRRAA